uniref:Uncharacterized protein n=1 Tax=Salix viminalis TaxID=40686 RepID=A0A6N2LH82_SALVM
MLLTTCFLKVWLCGIHQQFQSINRDKKVLVIAAKDNSIKHAYLKSPPGCWGEREREREREREIIAPCRLLFHILFLDVNNNMYSSDADCDI